MKNTIFKRILMIPMSVLIIVGVIIISWMNNAANRINSITVNMEDSEVQLVKFERIGLIPGETCEYKIKIKNNRDFVMHLDFVEVETPETKDLDEFAFVKIVSNGETICDDLLSDVFKMDGFVLPVDISEKINTELTIIYYLPIDVGNEAKNAEADFDLLIKVSD